MRQLTIKNQASLKGKGLHTGSRVSVLIKPAPENSGIIIENSGEIYSLHAGLVTSTSRGTVIEKGTSRVHTVEHMLAAVKALGLDNIVLNIDGEEAPAMDGSALGFVKAIKRAGIMSQNAAKKIVEIKNPIVTGSGSKYMAVLPADSFYVSYFSDFSEMGLAPQHASCEVTSGNFESKISKARTFGFNAEISALKKAGLIMGADSNNAVVFDEKGRPVNTRLRAANEPSMHKVLDIIGDFAFIPGLLKIAVVAYRTGHTENIEMVRRILKNALYYVEKLH
ncbi:MAG TPA: UDP-3-O-acyl-N-acetylglucosamine deacetylase [Candidatus Goldiibacteriota bacterium]|nr:UDP-3-O-acyl-N-acetylglucosamine deacetylase [Candidatus Goldiibacteriota bacterium]